MHTLPTEVTNEIAAHVALQHKSADLRHCAQVSRAFRDVFQPWLFNDLLLMDGDLPIHDHKPDMEKRRISRLLRTLTECPHFGSHTRQLVFMMGTVSMNADIPKIFALLPRIDTFRLLALQGAPSWNDLSTDIKQALVTVSRLPTLRALHVTGFRRLPLILLHTNPLLKQLTATNLLGVLPHYLELQGDDDDDDLEGSVGDFPLDHFKNLRKLDSFYSPPLENHQWMIAAIKASSESGSLRRLSLAVTQAIATLQLEDGSELEGNLPFGRPIDLTHATNLEQLNFSCSTGGGVSLSQAKYAFKAFCEFVHGTASVIPKTAPLRELSLRYVAGCDYGYLMVDAFWEIPAWKTLASEIGRKDSRNRHLQNVSLEIEVGAMVESLQAYVISLLGGYISDAAPDINLTVSFGPEWQRIAASQGR